MAIITCQKLGVIVPQGQDAGRVAVQRSARSAGARVGVGPGHVTAPTGSAGGSAPALPDLGNHFTARRTTQQVASADKVREDPSGMTEVGFVYFPRL